MLQVRENEISLRDSSGGPEYLRTQRNIADDAMQMDVRKTLYPFYTTKQMPHVTVAITEKRFFGSNSQVSWASAEIFPRGAKSTFCLSFAGC